jgi:cation diffusion facilitator family transporter
MVAVIVVTIMAYETILKGFKLLKHPEEATNFWLNFIVLAIAVIIDGSILVKAMKEIMKETRAEASGLSLLPAAFKNAGRAAPPTRLVFYEDIVATLGALFALIAIVFAHFFNFLILDGIATILIGCLMVGVAFKVGYDNMVGLIGVAAPKDVEEKISGIILADPDVRDINRLRILQEGRNYHVEAYIELKKGMTLAEAGQSKMRINALLTQDPNISDVTLGILEDDGIKLWNPREDLDHPGQ